jgi:hypothetical protein
MDITIHASFLPHDDPDASLAFYRDTLPAPTAPRRSDAEDLRRIDIESAPVNRSKICERNSHATREVGAAMSPVGEHSAEDGES